jgi:hypothetical protein
MGELWKQYKKFIASHKGLLIFNAAAVLIVYGVCFISDTVFLDTDNMMVHQMSTLDWLPIGRWGSVVLQKLFHLSAFNPYFSLALAFIFIVLFLETFSFFFYSVSGEKEYPFWIFCGLFISHPVFVYQWFFKLQNPEVAFSIFLIALSLILIFRWIRTDRKVFLVTGVLIMPVAFTTYEANYALYLSGALAGFLLLKGIRRGKEAWTVCLKLALTFLCGAAAGFGISRIFLNPTVNDAYATFLWTKAPAAQCLKNIGEYLKGVLLGVNQNCGKGYTFMLLAAAAAILFHLPRVKERIRETGAPLVIAFFLFLLSAFTMPILLGQASTYRNQYTLPFVLAAGLMASAASFDQERQELMRGKAAGLLSKMPGLAGIAVLAFILAAGLQQTQTTMRLWYTDRVRYEQDCSMLDSIVSDMHQAGISETNQKVIFYGTWEAPLNPACVTQTEFIGRSYFDSSSYKNEISFSNQLYLFAVIRGYAFAAPGETEADEAGKEAASMPSWPEKGYIRQENGYVIVKLPSQSG